MAWLDDRIRDHPKIARTTDRAFRHWVLALAYCSAHGTRGNLDAAVSVLRTPKAVVNELVQVGLWENADDGLWVHDWDAHNGKRDVKQADAKRVFDTRRQQLMRNPELRAAVRERDGDQCRYCGRDVNWHDRKGIAGATYDHVDPVGPNDLDNLVVCCRSCNSIKRGRTPQQAGLRLRAIPESGVYLDIGTRSDLDRDQAPDLTPASPAQARAPAGAGANDHDHDHDLQAGSRTSLGDQGAHTEPNGLPFAKTLLVTRILSHIGDDSDEGTGHIIRTLASHLPEASLAKALESSETTRPADVNRAAYIVGALTSERDARGEPPAPPGSGRREENPPEETT